MMADGMAIPMTYDVNNGNNGMFGGSGGEMWIFFLFFVLLAGGNGFGGLGSNNGQISNDFLYSNLNGQIRDVAAQNVALNTSISNGLCSLGYENLSNFKDMSAQIAACCCESNRNIDAVRYEAAKNTCDIIIANERQTDRILERLTQNEIQGLRDRVNILENANSNLLQSKTIVEQLRPFPQPAYITCSPYASTFGTC